ncbi:MAG: branched-chain amino acid ABC transporter permease, partial [Alphaproteobacteria bacterium]|nr:branched-chain amino acid ABC transporter permease [Alphaproteobacteria bacterium]
ALTEVVRLGWGPHALNVPASPLLKDIVWLLDEPYPVYRLFLGAAGLVVTLGVWVMLQRTPFGLYVRASWQNPEMVEAVGINVNLIRNLVVGLGFGLAGFAGVLAAPLLTANMGMGIAVIVDTFVIVVIGGLGSIAGTVLAAFAIALLRVLGDFYFPEMAMASQFLLMALVLAFRPGGLLGKAEV